MSSRMLKIGGAPPILSVSFVAFHWISGLRKDRTEHLPAVLGLILSLFAKYHCLLSYLRNQQRHKMEMRVCYYCLLRKSSHQVNWTFA